MGDDVFRDADMNAESDLARLSRITDSVFGVVVTLLAYRVRLPSREALSALAPGPLEPFLHDLVALVMSFLVATLFWLLHWGAFRRMSRSDFRFVALHFAFLGAMVLLPISTSLMSSASIELAGAFAYSANLFLLAATQTLFRVHARRLEPEAFGNLPILLTPSLLTGIFGAAAILSLFSPSASPMLWFASLVTPLIERRWGIGRVSKGDVSSDV